MTEIKPAYYAGTAVLNYNNWWTCDRCGALIGEVLRKPHKPCRLVVANCEIIGDAHITCNVCKNKQFWHEDCHK